MIKSDYSTRDIKLTSYLHLSPLTISEENYNRYFYYNNLELNLDKPCSVSNFSALLNKPDSPYSKDQNCNLISIFRNNITDSILDYYKTDIYATIPPNFIPTLLHGHTYYEVVYVLDGSCTHYTEEDVTQIKKGDILIIPPKTVHAISAFNDSCRIINILVKANYFHEVILSEIDTNNSIYTFVESTKNKTINAMASYLIVNTDNDMRIRNCIYNILYDSESTGKSDDYSKHLNILLLIHHINAFKSTTKSYVNEAMDSKYNISYILAYMEANISHINLSSLANFFGYSERQITRILVNYTGENYQTIIRHMKMLHAAKALINNQASIDTIAAELGYGSQYGFRKAFINEFGISPSIYRSQHK